MGLGDWLMCTGEVKKLFQGRPIAVIDSRGRVQWSEVFNDNPKITRQLEQYTPKLINGSGIRPYIAGKTSERWMWRTYHPEPGELFFTSSERKFALPYVGMVMIEPNIKPNIGHTNKGWIPERWQQLVDQQIVPMIQCGPVGTIWLSGVRKMVTPTFRHVAAILAVSKGFVGTEGGLHHAAAALGIPSVVLWSEFIDPSITGYTTQRNIRHAGIACGARIQCAGCRASMEAITVDEVASTLRGVL